jgi:hypothetical protein
MHHALATHRPPHRIKVTPALRVAAKMPLLAHHRPGERFHISNSEVVQWLVRQPEVQQEIFNWAKNNNSIVLDIETGCWHGAAWKAPPTENTAR